MAKDNQLKRTGTEHAAANASVKSAGRVFEILERFREVKRPLRLKELTDGLQYPTSSTASLLKCMADLGYLSFDRYSKTYLPTPSVSQLGDWITESVLVETGAKEIMKRVQEVTGELVILGTPNDIFVQYLEVSRSTFPLQYYLASGTRRLLVRSGLGWVFLGSGTDEELERTYNRTIACGEIDKGDLSLKQVKQKAEQARRDGYIYSRNTVNRGAGVIAMMLSSTSHGRRLAIAVGGPLERLDASKDFILQEMRRAISASVPTEALNAVAGQNLSGATRRLARGSKK